MAKKHRVYLVPGFFGFANFGDVFYFSHVREFLAHQFVGTGLEVEVIAVPTSPTASIRERALRLYQTVASTARGDDGPIHLIGHSSGGLDARLFAAPGSSLGPGVELEPLARRVRTVVTLSAPHRGTPLASFFTTLFGQRILQLLSLSTVYVLRFGRLPLSLIVEMGALTLRSDMMMRRANTIIDHVSEQLLTDLNPDRRDSLVQFFDEVRLDQSLVAQLTPESVDLFNSSAGDRAGVRYGCVVTRAPAPGMGSRMGLGPDPYAQLAHTAYSWLYARTSRMPERRVVELTPTQRIKMRLAFGDVPTPADNDGIVPTLSQVWGEIIRAVEADHLDTIGHFNDRRHTPPHYDWLTTGARFRRGAFEALWTAIAAFVAEQS